MYFYFDESGDYAFAEEEFDCYVQVALICPDNTLADAESIRECSAHRVGSR